MPLGNRGHIGIKKEVTWGTKVVGVNDLNIQAILQAQREKSVFGDLSG